MADYKKDFMYVRELKNSIEDDGPGAGGRNKAGQKKNSVNGFRPKGSTSAKDSKGGFKKDKPRYGDKGGSAPKTDSKSDGRKAGYAAADGAKRYDDRKGGKKYNPKTNASARGNRKPKEHDGFDDIKSFGGQYVPVDNTSFDDEMPYESFYEEAHERKPQRQPYSEPMPGTVAGRNAVRELLKSNRSIDKIYVKNGDREGSIVVLVAEAVSRGIPIVEVDGSKLDAMCAGANHQGIIAAAAEKEYTDVDGILEIARQRGEKPFIVIADGIEDPHNLGAIIRSAECAGAHGLIIPKRRAVGLTPTVTKASAGAIEHLAIAKVNNLVQTIDKLKKNGVWIFAAEAGGSPYYETDFDVPCAIVMGSEGDGVGKLVKERSDFIVSIPMYGSVNSLNVSTAAAVLLCHAARAHHAGK